MLHVYRYEGKFGKLRDWISSRQIPSGLLLFIMGIASTLWFLVRVIPKPSRASYPCMRVAAPFMSGFILYLFAVAGLARISHDSMKRIIQIRYLSAIILMFAVITAIAISLSGIPYYKNQYISAKNGPDDGPNQPFGTALGIYPGRVVWTWDTMATNRDCKDYYFKPENTDQQVVSKMFSKSVIRLTGESSVRESWDAMFRYFNLKKHQTNKGYTKGEKIFIKINQTSGRGRLRIAERARGNFYYPDPPKPKQGEERKANLGTCETSPFIVLEILRQLINDCGVSQSDIAVGDPQNPTYGHNYDTWHAEFPDVIYTDRTSGDFGRTLIHATEKDLLFYSDKFQTDKLYDIIENADYLINVANLKPHSGTGITLTAKNHFGSQSRAGAYHLHYSHLCQIEGKPPTNAGYHKYRVLVDLMGSRYLGRNTLLYVIDGLYGGGASEVGPPVKYYMAPFNGNWSSSIFISLDQVALESVCYDFLRTEWNGNYHHDPSNNFFEAMPYINGVDDYLHQAADSSNWPRGIIYDPDNSGKTIPSLGVHEHWNNPVNKQYSRNLGRSDGIELVSIPAYIVGREAPEMTSEINGFETVGVIPQDQLSNKDKSAIQKNNIIPNTGNTSSKGLKFINVVNRSFNQGFKARKFYAGVLDDDNGKWFLTDNGIVKATLFGILDHMRLSVVNDQIVIQDGIIHPHDLRNFVYELSDEGQRLWIATPRGAVVVLLVEGKGISDATVYDTLNSELKDDNVKSIVAGRNNLRWLGTGKGIAALAGKKWLISSYQDHYPKGLFKEYPITAMASNNAGDSLYVATEGAGVARVFQDRADGISGASQYSKWGPIQMPSDSVYSLCITRDGIRWIGTNKGVARHTGNNTLENWTVFNTSNGLVDDFVQTIAAEPYGNNIWFGTKGGVSVFDGNRFTSFTKKDGLISNNILFILIDKNGLVYLGTDIGIMVYTDGQLVCYHN
jgi:hypothetical protein